MTVEPTRAPTDTSRHLITAAWVLWALQVGVAVFAVVAVFLSRFSSEGCVGTCDYASFRAILNSSYAVIGVFLLGAAVAVLLLRHHPRIAIWCPVIGIVLTLALGVVSYALSRAALDLPFFDPGLGCCTY